MNIKSLNTLLENLKDTLGNALIMSDIYSLNFETSIVSYSVTNESIQVANKFSSYLIDMLKKAGLGDTCNYYAIQLEGNISLYVILVGSYYWSMLVNMSHITNGMMLVGVIPQCIEDLTKEVG